MGYLKSPEFIFFDGDFWKFKYGTVNKVAYKSESGELRFFSNWQIVKGFKEFEIEWPLEKKRRAALKRKQQHVNKISK